MCEPISASTAAWIAMGTTAASTAVSMYSSHQQAKSQQAGLNMQAEAAMRDANNSDAAARREEERGDQEARAIGQRQAGIRAKQAAGFAANGVDVGFGSAAATLDQTDYYGMEDQQTTARNATDASYSQRDRADQLRRTGTFTSNQAGKISPWMQTGATMLAGAGKVADRWYSYKKA